MKPVTPTVERGELREASHESLIAAAVLAAIALYLAYRYATRHPLTTAAMLTAATALAIAAVRVRARLRDRLAARDDPQGPGVIIGAVTAAHRGARRRPFYLPYASLNQHVLIDGPTGAGKTFTFIDPILRSQIARPDTGVLYLDGKGDPIHRPSPDDPRPAIPFDHVFWPENPRASARWNPLAGPDPVSAAAQFAAALYPDAADPGASFYEARAVWTITRVAAAMALTGYEVSNPQPRPPALDLKTDETRAALLATGMPEEDVSICLGQLPRAIQQLAWLSYRDSRDVESLSEAVRRNHAPPKTVPSRLLGIENHPVTPADLNRVLFGPELLPRLAQAVHEHAERARLDPQTNYFLLDQHRATLDELHHDLSALAELPKRDFAATMQNLQNRLGYFLEPPFLELCSRSDFAIGDICAGSSIALLLPTGRFPNAAKPLGRIALAQFRNAVLSSDPDRNKIAVLDEFHNFASGDFSAFLNQARSRGGGAVMAMQSLADFPEDELAAMLANIRTTIVTPGVSPADAQHWAEAFGKCPTPRRTISYAAHSILDPRPTPNVRIDHSEEFRFSPTEIAEIPSTHALIKVTCGRRNHAATLVEVERRPAGRR